MICATGEPLGARLERFANHSPNSPLGNAMDAAVATLESPVELVIINAGQIEADSTHEDLLGAAYNARVNELPGGVAKETVVFGLLKDQHYYMISILIGDRNRTLFASDELDLMRRWILHCLRKQARAADLELEDEAKPAETSVVTRKEGAARITQPEAAPQRNSMLQRGGTFEAVMSMFTDGGLMVTMFGLAQRFDQV